MTGSPVTTSGSNGTKYPVSPSTPTSRIPPVALATTGAPHAMRRLDHREPGIAGAVLDTRSLYAELICDGIHVAPEFDRLWLGAKGEERTLP